MAAGQIFVWCGLIALWRGSNATPSFKIEVMYKPEKCERKSQYGDQVFVHFVGKKLDTGEEFDRSHVDKPYRFQLGIGEVIEGFEEGLVDMCTGEKRKLTIPPGMAYGVEGGHLPQMPGGTILYEVEMVHAEPGPRHPKVFKRMDMDGDKFISPFEIAQFLRGEVEAAKGEPMSQRDVSAIVNDVLLMEDRDRDGRVSFVEFSGSKHDEL